MAPFPTQSRPRPDERDLCRLSTSIPAKSYAFPIFPILDGSGDVSTLNFTQSLLGVINEALRIAGVSVQDNIEPDDEDGAVDNGTETFGGASSYNHSTNTTEGPGTAPDQ